MNFPFAYLKNLRYLCTRFREASFRTTRTEGWVSG